MKYEKIIHGTLKKRVNRFIAEVYVNGNLEQVHIKNTGRLIELLLPDTDVILEDSNNPFRKTRYSLIAVSKNNRWINIDSQAPNKVAFEALKAGRITEIGLVTTIKKEVTFGDSRFDLYYEKNNEKGFIEVKGITLEKSGIALFPDAPTSRGTKHVLELIKAQENGYTCTILFVVQMKGCHSFVPNIDMDETFTEALLKASQKGVRILVYDSIVKEDELILDQPLPILS